MSDLSDAIRDVRDALGDAINAEEETPPNLIGSLESAQLAIDGKVNDIIILTDPPSLKPFNAGQTFVGVLYDDRVQFLQALRDYASDAYDESTNGNNQAIIGGHLWTIWNSRFGLYALYP